MFPTFLITFREVIEASIIISLVIGILKKLEQYQNIRIVYKAATTAILLSLVLVVVGSLLGLKVHELYEEYEPYIEGALMILSSIFITWAVFFLHNFSSLSQRKLTKKITSSLTNTDSRGLFLLIFSSVFREGFEIVLFLSTLYFTSSPQQVVGGFLLGITIGILVSLGIYRFTNKSDLIFATKTASIMLVLFSAGLLIRGIHEFSEVGLVPEIGTIALNFIPASTTLVGGVLKSLLGITQKINLIQIVCYVVYVVWLSRFALKNSRK
jgi:high-affinity iron transporter